MTQAFCHIVLHYSTARLSWTTIKSLHRNRNENFDVTPVEYEILMGWTLLAFHSIYVSSGVENAVRFVVPFYYYFKLIVIVATFLVPALISLNPFHFWSAQRGVSNPVVAAWFHWLIVPCVHRIHELMDHDPKKWAEEQLACLPLLFLDYFILPGILLTDEEREAVRVFRSDQTMVATKICAVVSDGQHDSPRIPPASLFQRDDMFPVQFKHDQPSKVETNDDTNEPSSNSTVSQSNVQTGLDQASPRQTHHALSPPHQLKTISFFNDETPDNATSFFPRTAPTSGTAKANLYVASPVAKSRVVSSSLRLRRFSREHESSQNLTPRVNEPVYSDVIATTSVGDDKTDEGPNTSSNDEKEAQKSSTVAILPTNEAESPTIAVNKVKPTKRRRRERRSLGDHFRELVTGDANIRVRDHLFDLELPLVPCPSPRRRQSMNSNTSSSSPRTHSEKNIARASRGEIFKIDGIKAIDTTGITTRRSSRLAKTHTRFSK